MADFDYVPINTTAEKIEKISNMDVLTGKVETENDNALVTATALLKTLDEDKIPIITSLLLKPLSSNEALRYKAGSNIDYIQYVSGLVDGEEVTTINNHYNILKGSVITLTYKAVSLGNGFSCFLTVKLDTPWIVDGYPKEGQFIYNVSVLNDSLEIIDISFKEVDQTYNPESENAQSGKAVAEAINGGICDEKYYDIDDNGVISLKAEYRGACPSIMSADAIYGISDNGVGFVGTKYNDLPTKVIIPSSLKGITVTELGAGMFIGNDRIEKIKLPNSIKNIKKLAFYTCIKLNSINLENIESLGGYSLSTTNLTTIDLPNLSGALSQYSIAYNSRLKTVTLGTLCESIGIGAFRNCRCLEYVSAPNVTILGDRAFALTTNLKKLDFVHKLTSIGKQAFFYSGFDYDWSLLPSTVSYGLYATSKQINPNLDWNSCNCIEKENNLPSEFSQLLPEYEGKQINENYDWYTACFFFTLVHAYCGLYNKNITTVDEIDKMLTSVWIPTEQYPTWQSCYTGDQSNFSQIKTFINGIGLKIDNEVNGAIPNRPLTKEMLQSAYDAIAQGKYISVSVPSGVGLNAENPPYENGNHAFCLYGTTKDKKFKFVDSGDETLAKYGEYKAHKGEVYLQNVIYNTPNTRRTFYILSRLNDGV